jgi:TRAP-type mannitol/chloroaromatic compound transport system permease large subunit
VPIFVPIIGALGAPALDLDSAEDLVLWFGVLIPSPLAPFACAIFSLRGVAPPEIPMFDIFKSALPLSPCRAAGWRSACCSLGSSPGCRG